MDHATRLACAAATAALVAACGGGGDGSDAAAPAGAPPVRATALAGTTAPAGLDFAGFRPVATIRSSDLGLDPTRFATPARTYVSLWYADRSGARQQVAFVNLAALRALDGRGGLGVQLPRDVASLSFEVYDRLGSVSGTIAEPRS